MKVLVTAGSTNVMIDRVRCISNIFKGKTGYNIAIEFGKREHDVTLITSSLPESDPAVTSYYIACRNILRYKTYDELYSLMEKEITTGNYDVVIHSAAVSDYKVEGTYASRVGVYHADMQKVDSSTKISSDNKELYLKLVPTEKIIDKIRDPWGFKGILVKFKLQVGISDKELIDIATKSMNDSKADFIVANCLEWSTEKAFIIKPDSHDGICCVSRDDLPKQLLNMVGGK